MSLLAGVACVAAWVAVGWWPMRSLGAALAGARWYGRIALACALGAAVTGLVQLALSACGLAAGVAVPVGLALVSLAGARWWDARGASRRPAPRAAAPTAAPDDQGLPAWLGALLIGIALIALSAGAGTPFRSDGSKFWAPKARELSQVGARVAPSLHDDTRLGVHRDYPLLVPVLLAPVFASSPPDATSGPKLALDVLGLALLGVLASLLPRCGTRGLVLLATFAAVPLFVSLDVRESGAATGFVDSVDALFLLLFVVAIESLRESPASAATASARGDVGESDADGRGAAHRPGIGAGVLLAALAGAALASTKLEGAVEFGLVWGAAWLVGPRRGAPFLAGLVALLFALPTFVIAAGVAPGESGFSLARLASAELWQARLLPVLTGLLGLLLDVSSFGLLPLLLVLLACERPGRRGDARVTGAALLADDERASRRRRFALLVGIGAVSFALLSYLSTNMQAERHIDTSAHRLLWHWVPAATWLAARRFAPGSVPELRSRVTA